MRFSDNPHKKSIILALVIILVPLLIMIISSLISRSQAANDLREAEREIFLEWFGDDDSLHQYMRVWEENGLLGLEVLSQFQVDAVINSFTSDDFPTLAEKTERDIESLLTGGFPLINGYGTEGEFNAERFISAIEHIQRILRLSDGVEDLDIRGSWRVLVGR